MIEPKKIEKNSLKALPGGNTEAFEYESEKHYIIKINEFIQKKYDIRYNSMTMDIEFKKKDADVFKGFNERAENDLWIDMTLSDVKSNGKETGTGLIRRIVNSNTFTKEFHPLREYLENLKWDGKDHLKRLGASLHLSAEKELYFEDKPQSAYFPSLLKRWFLNSAAIAVGKEGVGNGHVMLILEGKQQKGKTTWLNNLCPKPMQPYIFCGRIDPRITEVNTSNLLAEKWFINIDDQMQNIFSKDFNDIKSLITSPNITSRKSYDRSSTQRQRTASFMASVNGREIFTDHENRRYTCFCIDNSQLYCYDKTELDKIDIEQCWAQTMALLAKGEKYFYTADEMKIINSMNLMFNQTKPEEEWLMKCFAPSDRGEPDVQMLQSSEMLRMAQKLAHPTQLQPKIWHRSLEKYGFKLEKQRMEKYGNQPRQFYYVRVLFKEDLFTDKNVHFGSSYGPVTFEDNDNAFLKIQ